MWWRVIKIAFHKSLLRLIGEGTDWWRYSIEWMTPTKYSPPVVCPHPKLLRLVRSFALNTARQLISNEGAANPGKWMRWKWRDDLLRRTNGSEDTPDKHNFLKDLSQSLLLFNAPLEQQLFNIVCQFPPLSVTPRGWWWWQVASLATQKTDWGGDRISLLVIHLAGTRQGVQLESQWHIFISFVLHWFLMVDVIVSLGSCENICQVFARQIYCLTPDVSKCWNEDLFRSAQ